MSESEDRTQAPSKLRRQQARDRGQVSHSPELTGAAALLAGSLLLGVCGEQLATGLVTLVRTPWTGELPLSLEVGESVTLMRDAAFGVLGPLILLFLGLVAAGIAAHQAQVGGLWAPGVLALDPGRLWAVGGRGLGARLSRGAWILGKTIVILAVAVWAIGMRMNEFNGYARLPIPAMARGWCDLVRGLLVTMAVAAAVLGLIDYALGRMRFESMLRLTPDEAREDQKAMDGDPAAKSRRRRLAQALRGNSPELMQGARLVVTGEQGITVVLAGAPTASRINVRSSAKGATGLAMRKAAAAARVEIVEAPKLAIALALASSRPGTPLSPEILGELTDIWPIS